ncbi:MAG: putative colanic acid biosynthesis acetyltransferase [Novosphingobium sp.]|nr:putative colanic acid biosynthesis acetyltransferase [Novosphingobium sp.]
MSDPIAVTARGARKGGASFSLGDRLFRACWIVTWLALCRWTPPPLHQWRVFVLRLFGARLGKGCRIYASVTVWHPGNLVCGDNVTVGPGAWLYNQGRITIGDDVTISQRAHICASTHDVTDYNFRLQIRPISIGRHAWIAAEAFVGPGVIVAEGSVLAARGALFTSTEPYGMYRGNLAEYFKTRVFSNAPDD